MTIHEMSTVSFISRELISCPKRFIETPLGKGMEKMTLNSLRDSLMSMSARFYPLWTAPARTPDILLFNDNSFKKKCKAGDTFPMAREVSPEAREVSPMARDMSPRARDMSPEARDMSPRAVNNCARAANNFARAANNCAMTANNCAMIANNCAMAANNCAMIANNCAMAGEAP
jgi:hypothetical protein